MPTVPTGRFQQWSQKGNDSSGGAKNFNKMKDDNMMMELNELKKCNLALQENLNECQGKLNE